MNYVHLFFAFSSNYFLSFRNNIIIKKATKQSEVVFLISSR